MEERQQEGIFIKCWSPWGAPTLKADADKLMDGKVG